MEGKGAEWRGGRCAVKQRCEQSFVTEQEQVRK